MDRSRWDRELIGRGALHLERAAAGPPSAIHLEAAIAALHCHAMSVEGDRLAADRRPLRCAARAAAFAGRGVLPRKARR